MVHGSILPEYRQIDQFCLNYAFIFSQSVRAKKRVCRHFCWNDRLPHPLDIKLVSDPLTNYF